MLTTPHLAQPSAFLLTLAIGILCCACATANDGDHQNEQLPGAAPRSEELRLQLADALKALGAGYEPRTEHLLPNGAPRFTNRLVLESSPYLQQHAHNPVDWYPWGAEAFARAARENKPVFLSIGYSTCHWCHVMERESFDDVEIARLMNQLFVCIKVDRESRPDVDDIYMTAVQLLTGRGGWPMSSFLTPEGKPFFSGTYYPPQSFAKLLQSVSGAWLDQREQLLAQADRLQTAVDEVLAAKGKASELDDAIVERAVQMLLSSHDSALGGFSGPPKFPNENQLLFLLQQALRGDRRALAAVETTLIAMAQGGLFDQVGGGFHRYSTDERWLVPHFEKMLYNQANLSRAYAAAHDLTGKQIYARVTRQTLDYVLREMTEPDGGFYSATDADSEGEEGLFFVWTPGELEAVLGNKDAELVAALFGVTAAGNFEGRNILHLPKPLADFAAARGLELDAFLARLDGIRETLRRVREKREPPLRDDKILTAWNGMMISALAEASEVLDEPRYLAAASRAADLLWKKLRKGAGELWRLHVDGRSTTAAVLDDYAFFAEGLIALHHVSGEERFLARARELVQGMIERFWDPVDGGFFLSAQGSDPLLPLRPKSTTDGAIPSGSSVALRVLTRLAERTGEHAWRDQANAELAAFANAIDRHPAAYSYMLLGVDELRRGIAGRRAFGASGKVSALARVTATETSDLQMSLHLDIADGWHLNAHRPLQEELIATVLSVGDGDSVWRLEDLTYPEGERVRLSFQEEPLLLYLGTVEITARLVGETAISPPLIVPLRLRIQACDERACLLPENLLLEVPVAAERSQISGPK